jgi:hypothetical protein
MRTIIVRLFEPATAAGPVGLHGFVEDVQRGTRRHFTRPAQLLEEIQKIAEHGRSEPGAPGDDTR